MSHLTHLKTFMEVFRASSISRAAEKLGITQPAASLHIQSLEAFVGKPLFIRRSRGVVATDAAEELARSVSPFIDGLESRLSAMRAGSLEGGTVHFAGPPDFIHTRLANALVPLMDLGLKIRFHTGNKQRIYELLSGGNVDLAITASLPDERIFGYAHLLAERMLLVHSPSLSHEIGSNPDSDVLMKLPLIAYDEDLPLVRTLWSMMFQLGPELQASLTIPDLRIIRDLVIGGHGWSVLPDYHCTDALEQGLLVTPTRIESAPTNNLYLVWDKRKLNSGLNVKVREIVLSNFPNLY